MTNDIKLFALSLPILCAIMTSSVLAQTKPPSSICSELMTQFDNTEKSIAYSVTDGILDNSAIRSQVRATETGNALLEAQIVIELMKSRSCPLPSHAPTSATYFSAALACKTDSIKGGNPPSCAREKWVPGGPK